MIKAVVRTDFGKGASKKLRKLGMTPIALYPVKKGGPSIALSISSKEINHLVEDPYFLRTPIDLDIEGELSKDAGIKNNIKVIPEEIDFHPVSEDVWHMNFKVLTTESAVVRIPIKFVGGHMSHGLKRGGKLNVPFYYIKLLCQPDKIPELIEIDISRATIGSSVFISSLKLPEGTKLVKDSLLYSIIGRGRKAKDEGAEEGENPNEKATA